MASLNFTRTKIGDIVDGCGLGGVTCMGAGRMLAHMEDFGVLTDPVRNRAWRSENDGASWVELATQFTGNVWFYRSYSPAVNRVILGTEGPNFSNGVGYDPDIDDAVALTQNGGDSWSAAVDASAVFNPVVFNDFWQTRDFIPLDGGEIWAVGQYLRNGTPQPPILKSTNGGLNFTTFGSDPAGGATLLSGAYLGSDIVVVGVERLGNTPIVTRSTNRGVSWATIALPFSGTYNGFSASRVNTVAHLGGGVLIAGGSTVTLDGRSARLWRSTDYGQTWSELSSQIATTIEVLRVARMSALAAVMVMQGPLREPYFTVDGGATWQIATMSDALIATYDFVDVAVADDGAAVALYTAIGTPAIYIYRGVPDFSSAGPCGTLLAAGLASVKLDCGTPIGPNPCPQECD